MDRIDAIEAFVAALDEGSLAGAARRLRKSPAAITRALTFLQQRVGVRLLHRTTRALRLTEAGERYAAACRRVLADLKEADMHAAGDRAAPRGVLTISAPIMFGRHILRPLLDAFLDTQPGVEARLLLIDRTVDMVDEGVDISVRIAHLPDSNMIATRLGEVRRVLCAAPSYLANGPPLKGPDDLVRHKCIVFTQSVWKFPTEPNGAMMRTLKLQPRLTVNCLESAIASAVESRGVTRVLSYQVRDHVAAGRLALLLEEWEAPPIPVHMVTPEGRLSLAKVRAFADFVVPRLRAKLAPMSELAPNAA